MHQSFGTNFKVNPTAGLVGGVKPSTFASQSTGTGRLLDYLYNLLEDYSFAIVRNQMFSLVNITSVKQGFSAGYSDVDVSKANIPSAAVIVFTFSITPRPNVKARLRSPSGMMKLLGYDFIWGSREVDGDYMTISLTFQQASDFGLDFNTTRDLTKLYNIVGMCTKSFVLHPRGWYNSDIYYDRSVTLLRSLYMMKAPTILFRDVPIGYWIYNKYVWTDYSNLIVPRLVTPDFYLYFIMNLLTYVDPSDSNVAWMYDPEAPEGLVQYVATGLRKAIHLIRTFSNGTLRVEDNQLFCALYLLYGAIEPGSFGLNPKSSGADDFLMHLNVQYTKSVDKTEYPQFKVMLELFNDPQRLALMLLRQDQQTAKVIQWGTSMIYAP